jgi:hypothetical protein
MKFAAPLLILMLIGDVSQAQVSQSPCESDDTVDYPPLGSTPTVSILRKDDLAQWHPPSCAGWSPTSRPKIVVSLDGTFRFDGSMNELLARAGDISQLPAIHYWSARDKKWMPLARDASALNSANAKDRRANFSPAELKSGAKLFYWEDDPLTGETIYELKVYERTPDLVVIGTDNVTAVRKSIFTLFKPGASRSALFLQRVSPGVFRAHIVASAMQGTSSLVDGHEGIYGNRLRAIFGFLSAKSNAGQLALSVDQ